MAKKKEMMKSEKLWEKNEINISILKITSVSVRLKPTKDST